MGNQGSKGSLQKTNSMTNNINFVSNYSSGEFSFQDPNNQNANKESDVLTKFTWNYGGNQVLLTGSFNKWKQTIPLEKQGEEFSLTIELPRGLHYYKFIVDGQWRFSPEDPSIPDSNGNINNYIDTTNYLPLIENKKESKKDSSANKEETDKQPQCQGVDEFNKTCPRLPPHFEHCSFMPNIPSVSIQEVRTANHSGMLAESEENLKFQQSLTPIEINQLFSTPHCLPPPYHVQVDHIMRQESENVSSYCVTQRFKSKYTTFRYFSVNQVKSH